MADLGAALTRTERKCPSCHVTGPETEFFRNRARATTNDPIGHDSSCKQCRKNNGDLFHIGRSLSDRIRAIVEDLAAQGQTVTRHKVARSLIEIGLQASAPTCHNESGEKT